MVRKNVSPNPLVWVALALLLGTAGKAEPVSNSRLALWLSARLTNHSAITAAVRTGDQSHLHVALTPANAVIAPEIISNESCMAPATERRGEPPVLWPAHADRAPPGASLPTDNC